MKVAVVHDWLTGMRGGEAVLEAILEMYPEADLFTLLHTKGKLSPLIENRTIKTSFIDRLPFKDKKYRHYLPLFPSAIERFDFSGYDLVISSSHCVAKGVIVPPGIPHISYIHSPMRYVWDMFYDYFPPKGFLNTKVIPFFANYLRIWDTASAPRVDAYIANSRFVAERIRRFYGRTATIVHPPCITEAELRNVTETLNPAARKKRNSRSPGSQIASPEKNPPCSTREDFYLMVSALVPYKKADIAVNAFRDFGGRKLVVVGDGPELGKLKSIASPDVTFTGHISREEILKLYSCARALIFPGTEDFGIVPVEAQVYYCPVIAYRRGGAMETVIEDKTGFFFSEQTPESLRSAVMKSELRTLKPADFEKNTARFTKERFTEGMKSEISKFIRS